MRTFVDDIAAHAARHPDRVALTTPAGELTYAELAARIDALAGVLRARGARPEVVCAVAVERGVDAVVAMAAVVRSGAAFLSLDPEQPAPRLAALVRSGGAGMLLTCSRLSARLDLPVEGPRVLLDRPGALAAPDAGPATGPDGRGLAYVSHTSGTTGEPSAVLVEHRGLDGYLRFVARDYGLGPDTVALQVAPLGYDASVRDTFAPLLAGGRLVVVPRSAVLRPEEFGEVVRAEGVNTLLSVTPSFLSFLAGQPEAAALLAGLRLVVSSGESLRPFLAAGGRALVPGVLVNQYGPTECTMTSTRYAVPAAADTEADVIGTPIDGVVVRLLDERLAPVPDGTAGEVYIGGTGVARGYRGLPGRTAERFVPDPLGPPGARLYRTGDLARRGPGGLAYLGRGDRQVKIRGYRVDPAEVEGALLAHPAVTGAVVTSATDGHGRVFLTAHVTGDPGVPDSALRLHLVALLPPHLMPRRFVRLTELPTTRGGKADRRALAESGGTRS
ncbi:amino acid adenylation domain-containing protein [Streptomyces sp. NBC_00536]|uniref:amino acid adenylation domain-containing protein n=1 Tax=Streptomyces sp. NBC_00536 TaxID=2975769 RepID=UPI002E817BF4|nr:amino acid adenylation domain-containing protein [Streptomyces sp. NBC_00536]WUC77797.1 amino acid adenylation domain-containing protein [Streptomyces sp. NBC_00536]